MPFKLGAITADTVEAFQRCEEYLRILNGMIQTLNNKDVVVNVTSVMAMSGIEVTPCYDAIKELRVMSLHPAGSVGTGTVKWTDFRTTGAIWITAIEGTFKINLVPLPK